jgi:hypothetical protein
MMVVAESRLTARTTPHPLNVLIRRNICPSGIPIAELNLPGV